MTTATRLITLIMQLQNKPNQKAAGLAASLGVSVRTLHRYFGMLDEMGIPVYAERGPYGGFSLVRGYKLPPAPDLTWAASNIMAFGPLVEVLDPPELRKLIGDWAQKIVGLYAVHRPYTSTH